MVPPLHSGAGNRNRSSLGFFSVQKGVTCLGSHGRSRSEAPDRATTVLREAAGFPSRGGCSAQRACKPPRRVRSLSRVSRPGPGRALICHQLPHSSPLSLFYPQTSACGCRAGAAHGGGGAVGGAAGGGVEAHGRASPTGHVQHGVARAAQPHGAASVWLHRHVRLVRARPAAGTLFSPGTRLPN
jgi:hypothetical protein